MNPFKCRHCDLSAHFYFRDGGMLCPDHGALHATAQMKDMLERSRLDKSSCGVAESRSEGNGSRSMKRDALSSGSEIEPSRDVARGSAKREASCGGYGAGVASGPQDSIPLPRFIPPEAGALANTPLPVTAGAALSDDLPIFPGRKNATTFRVAANSGSQVSASSSFISPNHHQ